MVKYVGVGRRGLSKIRILRMVARAASDSLARLGSARLIPLSHELVLSRAEPSHGSTRALVHGRGSASEKYIACKCSGFWVELLCND